MTLRTIKPLAMPDITPGGADMPEPTMARAWPVDLLVDENYQRNLSERSVTLIRHMVAAWDWNSFQFPLCVKDADGRYHVVDGQHTAIAAASHPKIDTIPIAVIEAASLTDRARAFIGRNRDRIIVTPNQLHYAAVAAGVPTAVTIDRICQRAGVRILKHPPGSAIYFKPGDTLSIGTIAALLRRHGEKKARITLTVCGDAKLSPISAAVIRACEEIVTNPASSIEPDDLATALRAAGTGIEAEARRRGVAEEIPAWKALAAILTKRASHGRRSAA